MALASLDVPQSETRNYNILIALPDSLSSFEQVLVFRVACRTAIGVDALTPHLGSLKSLDGRAGLPSWYDSGIQELELMRGLLSGELLVQFDRILGPTLGRAEEALVKWLAPPSR